MSVLEVLEKEPDADVVSSGAVHKHSYLFNDRTALSLEPLIHEFTRFGI